MTSTLSTDADWLVDALSGIGRIMGCLKSHFTHHDLVTSTKEDPRAHIVQYRGVIIKRRGKLGLTIDGLSYILGILNACLTLLFPIFMEKIG